MNIRHWNSTHNDWLRALNFYKEEIHIFRQRLNEIAAKNTGSPLVLVEHYENQFVLHTEMIGRLAHSIRADLSAITTHAGAHAGFEHEELPEEQDGLEQQFIIEEKLFIELRHSFNLFCANWM
jgi:hypothetical protein